MTDLRDQGLYGYDFAQNLVTYLTEHVTELTYTTSMGTYATREVHAGRRLRGVVSFPSIDVQPGEVRVLARSSNGQLKLALNATLWLYTYNLEGPLSEMDNALYGSHVFRFLEQTATRQHFRGVPSGGTLPYLMSFYAEGFKPNLLVLLDGVVVGGSISVQGTKEVFT